MDFSDFLAGVVVFCAFALIGLLAVDAWDREVEARRQHTERFVQKMDSETRRIVGGK